MADTPHTSGTSGDADRGHAHGEDQPMAKLWMAMSGASAGGHHEEIPGVNPTSAKVGHEPDKFDARTIVYVPIAVAITLVITYLLVQGAFLFVNGKESRQEEEVKTESTDPAEIARVAKENQTKVKDWNDRSERIRNWTADPVKKTTPGDQPLAAVPQPQLEYNRQVNRVRLDATGKPLPADPVFVRSFRPEGNNSPEIYPESLRAGNFQDPWTGTKLLGESAWVKGHEGKLATVAIDDMIHMVAHDEYKGVLKVAEKKAELHPGTLGKPKISTGGFTAPLPAAGEPKKDDHHK